MGAKGKSVLEKMQEDFLFFISRGLYSNPFILY